MSSPWNGHLRTPDSLRASRNGSGIDFMRALEAGVMAKSAFHPRPFRLVRKLGFWRRACRWQIIQKSLTGV